MTDNDNPIGDVTWWWTPDCGHLHVETNPKSIGPHCPDRTAIPTADSEPPDA